MSLPRVKTTGSQSTCYSTETPTRRGFFDTMTPGFGGRKFENKPIHGFKLPGSPGCLPHQAGERRHRHPPIYCAENKVFFTFVHVRT